MTQPDGPEGAALQATPQMLIKHARIFVELNQRDHDLRPGCVFIIALVQNLERQLAEVERLTQAHEASEAENARLRAALEEIGDCGGKGFSHYCPNCSRKFNGNVALRHTPAPAEEEQ